MNTHQSSTSFPVDAPAEDRHSEKLSELLERLALTAGERITIRELATALEARSFGAFLLVFALPNLIPLPPGATLVLGLPMVFVAWQMFIGYQKVWLPNSLAEYTIERSRFQAMVAKVTPWLKRAETWVRPRRWPIDGPLRERLFGLLALALAVVCVVPIPFGNWLPAFAVGILGVAHTERDGNCLWLGVGVGAASIALAAAVVLATGALLMRIF